MPRRDADVSTLTCPQTVREGLACEELKARAGLNSDANLVRTALAFFARHIEPATDPSLWMLRGGGKPPLTAVALERQRLHRNKTQAAWKRRQREKKVAT